MYETFILLKAQTVIYNFKKIFIDNIHVLRKTFHVYSFYKSLRLRAEIPFFTGAEYNNFTLKTVYT